MDNLSKQKRSYTMAKIHSKDTKPEWMVRKFLFNKGFRYRVHVKSLPGCPDIVFSKHKIAIFVNGCFWHHHASSKCNKNNWPKSNKSYWYKKIQTNIARDRKNQRKLRAMGWHILNVWECTLKKTNTLLSLERKITKLLAIDKL